MIINVYKTESLEKTSAKLLEKIYSSGARTLVVDDNAGYINEFDKYLWTFSSQSFLPHGLNDEYASEYPIVLADNIVYTNNPDCVFVINKAQLLQKIAQEKFSKCYYVCNVVENVLEMLHIFIKNGSIVNYYIECGKSWNKENLGENHVS